MVAITNYQIFSDKCITLQFYKDLTVLKNHSFLEALKENPFPCVFQLLENPHSFMAPLFHLQN